MWWKRQTRGFWRRRFVVLMKRGRKGQMPSELSRKIGMPRRWRWKSWRIRVPSEREKLQKTKAKLGKDWFYVISENAKNCKSAHTRLFPRSGIIHKWRTHWMGRGGYPKRKWSKGSCVNYVLYRDRLKSWYMVWWNFFLLAKQGQEQISPNHVPRL